MQMIEGTVNQGKVLQAIPGSSKVLDQWANAWAMRLWLSDAKAKDDDKAKEELIASGQFIVFQTGEERTNN
jgi:hypothetical protein